jgi:predicted permease
MSLRAFLSRLLALHRRSAIDAELAEEIEEHLRLAAQTKITAGVPPNAAYDAARRAFGNPTLVRESSRQAWGWPALETWLGDLQFGWRMARKHRVSTVVAIASLGVGIGATSAVVSLLSAIMHPTYPFADSGRLAVLWARSTKIARFEEMQVSMPELRTWQRSATQTSVAGFTWSQSVNVAGGTPGALPTRTSAAHVTSNLLPVLGVTPVVGRGFTPDDERDDAPNSAIVTYDFWKELGGASSVFSTRLVIDREPYAIVGVMPPDFRLPILLKVKVLLPARRTPWIADRSARTMIPIGRLVPSATLASTSAEFERLTARFHADEPEDRGAWTVNVQALHAVSRAYVAKTLGILLTLAGVVLGIACANVAILLLARVPARRQELMVRLALGAERRRLLTQLCAESAWLAVGAAIVGAALVPVTMRILLRLVDGALAFELHPPMYGTMVIYSILFAAATCLFFGMAPAVSALRSLRDDGALIGARTAGAREQEWLRSMLLAGEVALSVVLIVGGWLMIESVLLVHRRTLGFDERQLVTARLLLDTARYRSAAARSDFYALLAERLRAHGELRDVTVGSSVPLGNAGDFANYATRDLTSVDDKVDTLTVSSNVVAPNYFDAMHIPIVAGAMFTGQEDEPVVVVNETLARHFWPGRRAIGQRLRVLAPMFTDGEAVSPSVRRVVAVTRDIRYSPTNPQGYWPNLYLPMAQSPLRGMYVAVRASTPAVATAAIRAEVAALDPLLPVFGVKSIDELFDYWFAEIHVNALIMDVLAAIGALLTVVGVYSVVAVFVSQRKREIGIRIAVGAQRKDVVRTVLRRTLRPTVLGTLVGLGAALAGSRTIASLLHGVSPFDPRAFIGAVLLLILVVVAGALLPAVQASRLDPITTLQAD